MLSQKQKIAIRRHLGVPTAGTAQAGRLYGWRFTFYNEDLEYRMNNLQAPEEVLLTGASIGSWKIQGNPTVGDVLTYNMEFENVVYTATYQVQDSDFSMPPNPVNPVDSSPLYLIALNSANAINEVIVPLGFSATGAMPADLFSPQYLPPYFAEVVIEAPGNDEFVLTSSVTGTTNLSVEDPGTQCPVVGTFLSIATGLQTTVYGYIAICDYLAMGMTQQNLSLWLEEAEVVFQARELVQRRRLYQEYVAQMARFIGGDQYMRLFNNTGVMGGVSGGAIA
jgi:hypothetical protein